MASHYEKDIHTVIEQKLLNSFFKILKSEIGSLRSEMVCELKNIKSEIDKIQSIIDEQTKPQLYIEVILNTDKCILIQGLLVKNGQCTIDELSNFFLDSL